MIENSVEEQYENYLMIKKFKGAEKTSKGRTNCRTEGKKGGIT